MDSGDTGGHPHDAGEILEEIANEMLRKPGTKEAKKHLSELIEAFFVRGGPSGESLKEIPEAREIFIRHHHID
jgi:hypothetical protein